MGPFACSALGALLQAAGDLPERRPEVGHGPPDQGQQRAAVLLAHGEVGAVLARREETIAGAMEAGADGFLAKDASSQQVAEAIRTLVDGSGSIVAEAEPAALPRYAM